MKIDLHIEDLVLEVSESGDRHRIGAAVRRELARLLAEGGLPPAVARGEQIPKLNGGSIEISQDTRPEAAGEQVAGAVYRGFKR